MIGRLQGTLIEKQSPMITIDTAGVGYEVETPLTTFSKLPSIGEPVTLFTHLIVREDNLSLCGFLTAQERLLFRTLIRLNGVGPKLALAILSGISLEQFVRCVEQNDIRPLLNISGVGRKTAERLLLELEDKLKGFPVTRGTPTDPLGEPEVAISALMSLGYKREEAVRAVAEVNKPGLTSEQLIRLALSRRQPVST